MTNSRILVAGIGNIFLGDDGFGVEVVRRLQTQPIPDGVQVIDFGTRGFDLACALMDTYHTVILVDTVARGGLPGTLYLIEPDVEEINFAESVASIEPHSLDPVRVLQYVHAVSGRLPRLRLLGCEPAGFGSGEEPQTELSPAVARSVLDATRQIQAMLDEFHHVTRVSETSAEHFR